VKPLLVFTPNHVVFPVVVPEDICTGDDLGEINPLPEYDPQPHIVPSVLTAFETRFKFVEHPAQDVPEPT